MNAFLVALQIAVRSSDGRPQFTFREAQPQQQCVVECPTAPDLGAIAARVGSYASTSTTQWQMGSGGPYSSAWLD